jgi:ribosomal protein S18 acetylase RimI-like enzyme
VTRGHVIVRAVTEDDVTPVLEMWDELRAASPRNGPLVPAPSEQRLRESLRSVEGDDSHQAVVAEVDGVVVGMAVFIIRPMGPFVDTPVLQIDYLHVRPAYQRRGVGHALMTAATTASEDAGVEHVSVNVFPQLREANRFYAKIGFTPMVVRRVAPVVTLRRRLGLDGDERGRRAGLLARRRSARRNRAAAAPALAFTPRSR